MKSRRAAFASIAAFVFAASCLTGARKRSHGIGCLRGKSDLASQNRSKAELFSGIESRAVDRLPKSVSAKDLGKIGATGFEPMTFCSQSRRATRLRHAPSKNRSLSSQVERGIGIQMIGRSRPGVKGSSKASENALLADYSAPAHAARQRMRS